MSKAVKMPGVLLNRELFILPLRSDFVGYIHIEVLIDIFDGAASRLFIAGVGITRQRPGEPPTPN
ncbi:MAG: hypothetical protein V1794_05230 [Candidatus Glassbacteria bacterium]